MIQFKIVLKWHNFINFLLKIKQFHTILHFIEYIKLIATFSRLLLKTKHKLKLTKKFA